MIATARSPHARPDCLDADAVIARLEEAGRTLMAQRLRHPGPAREGSCMPTPVRDFWETYGTAPEPLRAAIPSAADITAADEALAWVPLYIPRDRAVVRRIVHARVLTNWQSGRPVYTWKRLGLMLGADWRAVQRWHGAGIGMIVCGLSGKGY